MILKIASNADISLLAEMNQDLIIDEKSLNPMTYEELCLRMSELINSDWIAYILEVKQKVIGYVLFKNGNNPFDGSKTEVYIRQYFIRPEYRNQGYGRKGINLLREQIFRNESAIIIDVLESNPLGKSFWESIGFETYYTNMRLSND